MNNVDPRVADLCTGAALLITGGRGFIGGVLLRRLQALRPSRLVCLGRNIENGADSGVEYRRTDLAVASPAELGWMKDSFDVVFHCAGVIDQSTAPGIYDRQAAVHMMATVRLLEATRGQRVRSFVQVGSNAEYGLASTPQAGDGPCRPNSAYGVTKLAASNVAVAYAMAENMPARVVRPFLVYGPGMNARSFLGMALAAARAGSEFPTTPGEQTRDFISVERVVDDLLLAAADPALTGRIVNSCSGVERSVRSVLEELVGLAPGFRPVFGAVPYRATEMMSSVGVPYRPMQIEEAKRHLRLFLLAQLSP